MHLTLFETGGFLALAQVVMIDIVLAGDNAVVIGLAAARVPPEIRILMPGRLFFSTSSVLRPRSAARVAANSPAAPAPTTTTSQSCIRCPLKF